MWWLWICWKGVQEVTEITDTRISSAKPFMERENRVDKGDGNDSKMGIWLEHVISNFVHRKISIFELGKYFSRIQFQKTKFPYVGCYLLTY